jgi:putative transposase
VTETNVFQLAQPGTFTDSLTEVMRHGARALLVRAIETEVAEFLGQHAELKTDDGRQRLVRHEHLPKREIMTGIGSPPSRPAIRRRRARHPDLLLGGLSLTFDLRSVAIRKSLGTPPP